MAKKSKRHADAASIVGEDIADELEAKSQEQLVGRADAEVDPSAVVVKDKDGFPPRKNAANEAEAEDEGMATGTADEAPPEEEEAVARTYGGAMTLNQAEAFLVRENGEGILLGDWDVLAGVLTNISGEDNGPAIREELKQFQSRVDIMAVKALSGIVERPQHIPDVPLPDGGEMEDQMATGTADVEERAEPDVVAEDAPKDQPDPFGDAMGALAEAVTEAASTPVAEQDRLKMIQPAMNGVAEVIRSLVVDEPQSEGTESPSAENVADQIENAVNAAVAPLAAKIEELTAKAGPSDTIPTRRAASFYEARASVPEGVRAPGESASFATIANPMTPSGAGNAQPGRINPATGTEEGDTPNLSKMIRRSVGIVEE